jgi:hypothetical protein
LKLSHVEILFSAISVEPRGSRLRPSAANHCYWLWTLVSALITSPNISHFPALNRII